ncbi:MAG: response regulator transcription factor [Bacteroidia bacterium]|nr:response regulator transcription factor [Bacteroidia bacterium]
MQGNLIRTAIVEDDQEIRQLLQLIIGRSPGFTCEYAFESAEEAIRELPKSRPDLILMDINLPGMSGIEATAQLRVLLPNTDILMLSVNEDDDSVFDSLCAGASGYLLKETPPAALLEAIREAKSGGAPMSAQIARKVVRSFRQQTKPDLTERESEILAMLCRGDNYRTVADAIFVSTNTVKAHIKNIYRKLEVHSRAEAVSRAIRNKWV